MKQRHIALAAIALVCSTSLSAAHPPRLLNGEAMFRLREAPADTLKRGERAMTALDLAIASDGLVTNCTIALSSKVAQLDERACALVKANARFEPSNASRTYRWFWVWEASKNTAEAKTSKASPAIRGANAGMWVTTDDIPRRAMAKDEDVTSNVFVTISDKGQVTACTASLPSERLDLDDRACAIMEARANYRPARDREGRPTNGVDWMTVRWRVPVD